MNFGTGHTTTEREGFGPAFLPFSSRADDIPRPITLDISRHSALFRRVCLNHIFLASELDECWEKQ